MGLDGERATGEELNQLMKHGYRVYHDMQAGEFNIDHIVIGPSGVYAVETKYIFTLPSDLPTELVLR